MKKFRAHFVLFACVAMVAVGCLNDDEPEVPSFEEQLEKDIQAIDTYLASKNIVAQTHTSGLRYVIHETGTGNKPTADSCVTSNYKGLFLSSEQKFDEGQGISFPLKGVIDGWRLGIPLLNEGDSATLYVPSGLGYGYYGYPPVIPSNANLIFNVKVLKVGQVYSSSPGPKGSCD